MKRGPTGYLLPLPSAGGENARAFVPNPLPPEPPLTLDPDLQELIEKAMLALGRLDGLTAVLPDPALFIYSYVRLTGDWEAWLRFFIAGVQETATQAAETARALMKLAAADEKRVQTLGKPAGSALRVHRLLQAQPIVSIAVASRKLSLTAPTVTSALGHLESLGIVRETTGGNYGRLFAYDKYLKILNAGTEPLK